MSWLNEFVASAAQARSAKEVELIVSHFPLAECPVEVYRATLLQLQPETFGVPMLIFAAFALVSSLLSFAFFWRLTPRSVP